MKPFKVVFINRSQSLLRVHCKHCNRAENDQFTVKKRSGIRLQPGRYNVMLHYDNMNIDLETNLDGGLEVGDIPTPGSNRYRAKLIVLNYPNRRVRIICREKISVVNLIQGGKI